MLQEHGSNTRQEPALPVMCSMWVCHDRDNQAHCRQDRVKEIDGVAHGTDAAIDLIVMLIALEPIMFGISVYQDREDKLNAECTEARE